ASSQLRNPGRETFSMAARSVCFATTFPSDRWLQRLPRMIAIFGPNSRWSIALMTDTPMARVNDYFDDQCDMMLAGARARKGICANFRECSNSAFLEAFRETAGGPSCKAWVLSHSFRLRGDVPTKEVPMRDIRGEDHWVGAPHGERPAHLVLSGEISGAHETIRTFLESRFRRVRLSS